MTDTDIEVKAREIGWVPQDEFRGDPDGWRDAETYLKRGETLLPLVKASNRRLTEELASVKKTLAETQASLKDSQEAIGALKEFNSEANRKAMREQIVATKAKLVEAKKEGDVEQEVELVEQLQTEKSALSLAEKEEEPAKKTKPAKEEPSAETSAEWKAWAEDNTWFGQDKRRTALAMGIADELRADPKQKGLNGRAFLDRVTEEVEKVFGGNQRPQKVEGGGRGSSSGGGGKSYADLPQEAKDACERQAGRLVGPSRAFKTAEEWRKHYVKTYYEEAVS